MCWKERVGVGGGGGGDVGSFVVTGVYKYSLLPCPPLTYSKVAAANDDRLM